MNKSEYENLEQNSKVINYEFSESGDFVDITTRLCYLNDYNANGFKLKTNEDNEDKTKKSVATLLNMPVVAYYNSKKKDFEGHKVTKTKDGSIKFGTQAIGTHTDVWIEDDKVIPIFSNSNEEVELPCIFAKARIWGDRFPKYYNVLKKRLKKKQVYTSWELNPITLENDVIDNENIPTPRSSDEWIFLGNCLLGATTPPAYGKNSKIIETSTISGFDIELSEALSEDINSLPNNTSQIDNNSIDDINIKQGGKKIVNEKINEISAMTDNDLYTKVRKAINNTDKNKYYYMAKLYPYDFKAMAYEWDRDSDDDYTEFSYSVNSDETISINSQKEVKMVFVPKDEIDTQISELQEKLSTTEKEFSEAGKAVAELAKEKETLESKVAEMTQYKEKIKEIEQAEKERELADKKDELEIFTLEDELITKAELKGNEQLSSIFSELSIDNFETSKEKIEVIKGRKAIEKFKASKTEGNSEKNLETSSTNKTNAVKSDLNSEDEAMHTATDIVKMMLNKK